MLVSDRKFETTIGGDSGSNLGWSDLDSNTFCGMDGR